MLFTIYSYSVRGTHRNTHTAGTRDEPTPHNRTAATGHQWVVHGGHDGGEDTADTDGEREGREVAKLTFEHRFVAEPGRQFGIGAR